MVKTFFQIYRRLIGSTIYRTRSAIYYTRSTYRNISDALARLTSDHKYFSIHIQQHQYITVNCRKKRKGSAKISTSIYTTSFSIHFSFLLHLSISNLKIQLSFHIQPLYDKLFPQQDYFPGDYTWWPFRIYHLLLDCSELLCGALYHLQQRGATSEINMYISSILPIYRQYIGNDYEYIF